VFDYNNNSIITIHHTSLTHILIKNTFQDSMRHAWCRLSSVL